MAAPIPYKVQSGENLQDIAKKLGIKDWMKLKEYHDQNSEQATPEIPYAGFTLMTPSKEDVYELNGETPPPDPVEEQKSAEEKQEQEKKKEEEEKQQEKASKSEHDGKYFVVHNAKCVCDKAVNPKQTADLQVTSHQIIVFNDQTGKLAATEEDKTFIPPAATFGQCKLKPSSGGYLPCALSPAPKWSKTYESTKVQGKNTLTEISELQCMIGGKITIEKHGQTDSVSNAHADNTNPLELAAVNPAIQQPKKKEEYPVVTSIAITEIENREGFKEKDSKEKELIYLRKNEEASFRANLKSGNKQLTSWMVYTDHQGSKENRLLVKEQIGTEFSQSFGDLGKFRVEGYGKPKNPEFEKGKYDKCDPSCSIDVEVVENTLLDIEVTSNSFSTRIDSSKNRKFRKGVPSVFKAKFFIPRLNEEEKSRLQMSVLDGAGNTVSDAIQKGTTLTFIPKNSAAKYTIIAKYANEKGETIEKTISGETEGNVVLAISHSEEIVRPGTPMTFSITKMRYDFGIDPDYDLTTEETSEIKWNLNGVLIGTGKSITIPGNQLLTPKKYTVEAYSKLANATGKGAKKEDDDWHFEVKQNDVKNIIISGTAKVGKPITMTVETVYKDLIAGEIIHWKGFSNAITGQSITYFPKVAGSKIVSASLNNGKASSQTLNIVEAKIKEGFWHDLQGSEITKARWGQKVFFSIAGENLKRESINATVFDKDKISGIDFGINKSFIFGESFYTNFELLLDNTLKKNTTSALTPDAALFVQAQIAGLDKDLEDVPAKKGTKQHLEVTSSEEVYRALIGDANGKNRHNPVDYDIISWVYANTTYPKDTKLKVKIFESAPWYNFDQECKELEATGTVKEDGALVVQINWGKLKDAKQNKKTKTYYAVIYDEKDNKLLDGSDSDTYCKTVLIPQSILAKQAGYTGAVLVGSDTIDTPSGTSKCPRCEAKITVDEFKKMFPDTSKLFDKGINNLKSTTLSQFLDALNKTFVEFEINTCIKKAFFLSQITKETGVFTRIDENLDYRTEAALHTFWLRESNPKLYTNPRDYFNNPEKLGNYVYRNIAENGNEASGDGYKYRGRGLIQITRKKGYRRFGEYANNPNILSNPNLLLDDLNLMTKSAGWYWKHGVLLRDGSEKDINIVAQTGDFTETTRLVHGGTKDIADRLKILNKIKPVLRTDECQISSTDNKPETLSDADIEYHIYFNGGEIHYKIHNAKREIAQYYYHDSKGNVHELSKIKLKKISDKYGGTYKDRLNDSHVYLADIRDIKSYSKDGVIFKLAMNTKNERYYLNDVTIASLIGAILDLSFIDFTFNGFSDSEGRSIAGSNSHKNGMNGDLRYLRKDKSGKNVHLTLSSETGDPCGWKGMDEIRQNQFNDTLYKYGWKSMLSWKFDHGRLLHHCAQYDDHYHHLHVQSYKPILKEIK